MASSGIHAGRRSGLRALAAGWGVLVLLAGLCGGAANLAGPRRIPWQTAWSAKVSDAAEAAGIRVVTTEEAGRIVEEGMHFLFDARAPEAFAKQRLPGAMNLYSEAFDEFFPQYAMMLVPEQPILVYCSGKACDESLLVGKHLAELGFTNLVLFAAGMEGWLAAGLPTEGAP